MDRIPDKTPQSNPTPLAQPELKEASFNNLKVSPDSLNSVLPRSKDSLEKHLFSRKVSILKEVKTLLSNFSRWLKNSLSPSPKLDNSSFVYQSFMPFQSDKEVASKLVKSGGADQYLVKSDFNSRLRGFLRHFDEHNSEGKLLNHESVVPILSLLKPYPYKKGQGTSPDAIRKSSELHGVELKNTSDNELVVEVSGYRKEQFEHSLLFKSYQLYQAIRVLIMSIDLYAGDNDLQLSNLKDEAQKINLLVLGLCHSLLKEQLPNYFDEVLYTDLIVTDDQGQVIFCVDNIQPRGGWFDTDKAISRHLQQM